MSDTETFAILGAISSIISIVDEIKQVYDAATNAQGLPEAFRAIAGRLPIIRNILGPAKQHIDEGDVDEDSCKRVKHVVEACEEKAEKLVTLFQKAIPKGGASDLERYYKAVKAHGKGNEVENLMKGMLEDVQLLTCERGMNTVTKAQQEQIAKAVTEVSAVLPSVPEHLFQETGLMNTNSGSGTQYNAQGEYFAQGNARQDNTAGGTMYSGTQYNAQGEYVAQGNARQYNTAGGTMYIGSMEDTAETCLAALFLTDPRDDREQLIQAKGSRVVGTCEWIKSNKLYKSWLQSHFQLLWLSGGPGKGKTMLSIFLAEELEQTAKHSQDIVFLQYFCDNKDEKRKTAMTIIRGLIFQLLQSRQKLFNHILPSFKVQKESLFAGSSFETLWGIFENMIRDPILGTTYCVLDGLDECDEASSEVLLRKFAALFSAKVNESSVCHLNLIVVSRDLPDFIPQLLSTFPRIRLDPDADTEISNDINQFIEVKVEELAEYRQYTESLRVQVKRVFQNRAQGTFLWVGIVANTLRKYKATEVKKALDLFPPGLNEMYARMLLQIDIDRREVAIKMLRWVVMAVRPLTLSELSIAIDTTARPSDDFSHDEVMRDQVSYCEDFLTIKEDKVSLIHQSAKDYLLRKTRDSNSELEFFRVREEVVNLEIARRCLGYLQDGALAAGKVDLQENTSHLKTFPFLSYAALHWPEHARSLAPSEDIFDLSLSFYHKKSRIRESWLKTYWALANLKYDDPLCSFTLLHLASFFGIQPLAENLLRKKGVLKMIKPKLDLDLRDGRGMTALMYAAKGGYEALVRLLLEKGADLKGHIYDSNGNTALHLAAEGGHKTVVWLLLEARNFERIHSALVLAARGGHEAVVRMLLEKGANVNAKTSDGETALRMAAMGGDEAVVRLLLEKGAKPGSKDSKGNNSALVLAAEGGHEAVVRLLLEKKVDLEVKTPAGSTALLLAAWGGHEAMLRLLLDKGANVHAKTYDGETALQMAAWGGHEVMVRLLLEMGIDFDAKNSFGWTALQRTVWGGGREAVVRLLLKKGADLEAKNPDGDTALLLATNGGHEAVVRLLLKKGADLEAKNADGNTALLLAAWSGHEAIGRLLLKKGADLEVKNFYGHTVLLLAAWSGHEAIVRLLLEKGVDLDVKDIYGDTALLLAAKGGHEAMVRLLLGKGADVNAQNYLGWTALHLAARYRHEAMVRLLLEKGADLDTKSSDEETALHRAARGGHEAAVWLLLEKGADLEAKNFDGDTALHLATRHGHENVVRLLLKKGGDLEAKNYCGDTALHLAAGSGHEVVVRQLLEEGRGGGRGGREGGIAGTQTLEAKNFDGYTALHLATRGGHDAVVQLLTS